MKRPADTRKECRAGKPKVFHARRGSVLQVGQAGLAALTVKVAFQLSSTAAYAPQSSPHFDACLVNTFFPFRCQ